MRTPRFYFRGALVRELRSHMPCGEAKICFFFKKAKIKKKSKAFILKLEKLGTYIPLC